MTIIELNSYFQSALLFNVPKNLVRLSYEISKNKLIVLAIFENIPMDYERDCINSTVGEVLGNYSEIISSKVEYQVKGGANKEIDLQNLVFAQYDSEMY
ncbi:hypothetical protein [Shewanella sp. 10N.286.52.A9]|uniref:hypothetical protein n=1 Tax=Shewanella sp. 10N.286.52.A9 TaxID=3229711 RepID=UPI00355274F8